MREMIAGLEDGNHGKESKFLVEKVTGNSRQFRDALRTLDKALIANKPSKILKATRNAVEICAQSSPELADQLKQHIAVRSWMLDIDAEDVSRAAGGPSLKNAYFWRLHARAMEMKNNAFWACAMWEEFRKHALHEGWFAENSAEESAIYLYMADLLNQLSEEDFDWLQYEFKREFKGFEFYYRNQPRSIREAIGKDTAGRSDPYFLHPENLYRLASTINPSAETYRQWLKWAETHNSHWKQYDGVALAWHAAFPEDSRPLLFLMKSAEQRNALKKALGYLDTAERIDGLNPDVKRARLRLLAAAAVHHLKQQKTHLAQKDIAAIEGLPQAREGHRPAFVAALKCMCAAIDQNESDLNRWKRELEALLEYPLAAEVVFQGLLTECRFSDRPMNLPEFIGDPLEGKDRVAALARGCQLGEDMRIAVAIPQEHEKKLRDIFTADGLSHDNAAIRAIAENALKNKNLKLAYAAAGAGLLQGGAATARFLLLRARSLPLWEMDRKDDCIAAAIELARREREMDLLDEAIELRRSGSGLPFGFSIFGFMLGDENSAMETEELNEVLAREKTARDYPSEIRDDYFFDFDDDDFDGDDHRSQCRYCDVRNCPDRKAPYSPHKLHDDACDDDFDDMDNLLDFDDMLDEIRNDLPPELWSLIKKVYTKHGRNGSFPDPDEVKLKDPWLADQLLRDLRKAEIEGDLRVFDRDWLRRWRPGNSTRKRR